ncbi:hypothetical protein VNI00_018837 [Paramarasmius palmivorus]|uniref:Uncharacterized protein n=1 Tax=Paramarasmius palmivorus TaxID=297713 RepID=A0AAW0ATA4_9AGAR
MDSSEYLDELPVLCETPTDRIIRVDFYMELAYVKFASAIDAIQTIFRIGKPPASHQDVSRPSSEAKTVLEALAYFGCAVHDPDLGRARHEAIELMKKYWPLVGSWVDFLLQNHVLGDEELTTYDGIDFYDNVLNVLPMVLSYPDLTASNVAVTEGHSLRRMAPKICQQAVRTWIKVMKTRHVSWSRWTLMIKTVYATSCDDLYQFKDTVLSTGPSAVETVARIAIRHMTLVTQHAHKVGKREFPDVHGALLLILQCLGFGNPSALPFLRLGGIPALVKMIATLISKPKTVEAFWGDEELLQDVFRSGEISFVILGAVLPGPDWISQALEAGIMDVIFQAERLYGDHEVVGPHLRKIWHSMEVFFERMILYVVYPSVVVRFIATTKKILGSDVELSLMSRTPEWELLEMWKILKSSMIAASQSLGAMKCNQGALCAFTQWTHTSLFEAGRMPGRMDIRFFGMLMHVYIRLNISEVVKNYRSTEAELVITREDAALVFSEELPLDDFRKLNHYVIVINFNIRGRDTQTLALKRCTVKHLKQVVRDHRFKEHRKELLKLCDMVCRATPREQVVVVGFFPSTIERCETAWPVVETIQLVSAKQ